MPAGTAVRESVSLLSKVEAKVAGLVVAIDRQEVAPGETKRSAVDAVREDCGFPVVSIVTLRSLLKYCAEAPERVGGAEGACAAADSRGGRVVADASENAPQRRDPRQN